MKMPIVRNSYVAETLCLLKYNLLKFILQTRDFYFQTQQCQAAFLYLDLNT